MSVCLVRGRDGVSGQGEGWCVWSGGRRSVSCREGGVWSGGRVVVCLSGGSLYRGEVMGLSGVVSDHPLCGQNE